MYGKSEQIRTGGKHMT